MPSIPHDSPSLFDGKLCTKCGAWKPLTGYKSDKRTQDGRKAACRTCQQAYDRSIYPRRKEKQSAYYRDYYLANKDRLLVANRERDRLNHEHNRAHARAYRAANPDVVRAYKQRDYGKRKPQIRQQQRAWEVRNADRIRMQRQAYYAAHGDQIRQHVQKYRIANRDAVRVRKRQTNALTHHRRRARLLDATGNYTQQQWCALCDWFGNVCLCCGAAERLTVDHVLPLARGGSNDIANLQCLCTSCNSRKYVKTIDYRDPEQLKLFLASLARS